MSRMNFNVYIREGMNIVAVLITLCMKSVLYS